MIAANSASAICLRVCPYETIGLSVQETPSGMRIVVAECTNASVPKRTAKLENKIYELFMGTCTDDA